MKYCCSLVLLLAVGCGGDNSMSMMTGSSSMMMTTTPPPAAPAGPTAAELAQAAQDKCNDLLTLTCRRITSCAQDGTTIAECVQYFQTTIDCTKAIDVDPSYSTCIDQLTNGSCSVLLLGGKFHAPASCSGVIKVRE